MFYGVKVQYICRKRCCVKVKRNLKCADVSSCSSSILGFHWFDYGFLRRVYDGVLSQALYFCMVLKYLYFTWVHKFHATWYFYCRLYHNYSLTENIHFTSIYKTVIVICYFLDLELSYKMNTCAVNSIKYY